MDPAKFTQILSLSPEERYDYFLRYAAEWEKVWLIQQNGKYVTLGDGQENIFVPVWPEKEFAEAMLQNDWNEYLPHMMETNEFLSWLDGLHEKGYSVAAFPSQDLQGVVVSARELKEHLLLEIQQYE